jgi:Riboflavin synthase alpha chain
MFTGIVEELGEIVAIEHGAESAVISVRGPLVTSDATRGASIAVNGVCLTVVNNVGETFSVDVMAETLNRSSLGSLEPGARSISNGRCPPVTGSVATSSRATSTALRGSWPACPATAGR